MYRKAGAQKGFTVIELLLAMGFFSVVLIFIVATTTQLLTTYNKGLTVRSVNQSGRSIATELQRSIRDASRDRINLALLNQGRLCTGTYSYVWSRNNAGITSADTNPVPGSLTNTLSSNGQRLNFARLYDPGRLSCVPGAINLPPSQVTELLSPRLTVRNLNIYQSSPDTGLYTIRFVITSDDGALLSYTASAVNSLTASDLVCRANIGRLNDQFCATNLFVVYAYAKN